MEKRRSITTWISITSGILGIIVSILVVLGYSKTYPSLNGAWMMSFTVEETSYNPYMGDVSVYQVFVTQTKDGGELIGEGEQKKYNGKYAKKKFKMKFAHGTINKDIITIQYRLFGSRETEGIITLKIDPDNKKHLIGIFEGSAANTKGKAEVFIN